MTGGGYQAFGNRGGQGVGHGYQIRWEARDNITGIETVTGPTFGAPNLSPPHKVAYKHVFSITFGFDVVLARDLTDSMYDPRTRPFVSHARGTELVIEHIERMWCSTILSEDLTRVVPGSADPDPAGKVKRTAR